MDILIPVAGAFAFGFVLGRFTAVLPQLRKK